MITDTPIGRAGLTSQLEHQLGTLVSSVEIAIRNNLSSSNVVAETTLAGLLNLVYGWDLVNANAISQNYPGVDLIDQGRNIAVQVTSTRSVDKVRHTLTEVAKLGVTFDRLIVLIITNQAPTKDMKSCTVTGYSGSMEIWNIPEVFRVAKELDAGKLEKITEYMAKELGPVVAKASQLPHLHLPLSSALQPSAFVGREDELTTIREKFEDGDKLVVLTGLGGMGKTELAVKFGRDYAGTVYFARFDTSFTKTLATMAQGIRPALSNDELGQPEGDLCAMVQELLSKADTNDLLIVDNADTDSLADLCQALMRLPLKVLLTTRSDWDEGIPVEKIADEHLREILTRYGAKLTVDEMDAIIKTVNGHTLTIDLIARTLNGKGLKKVTAKMMIESLKKNTLPSEKYRKIATHYNQSTEQAQIYQHLSTVFNVSDISDGDKELLRCATLFPESGISGDLMAGIMNDDGIAQLESLMERGWLEMKDDLLMIHPVVRLVCRTELEPTDENCGDFLNALWGQLSNREYDRIKFAQLAEVFALAADHLEDQDAQWINNSGRLRLDLAQYDAAKDLYEKHLPDLEKRLKDTELLATVYNNLGSIYGHLGDHSKALEFMLKALEIREKVLPPDHPDLAASYNNVGTTYGNLGDHSKALEFQMKDLAICEKVLPPDHPDLAVSYNNVGTTYSGLGDHRKALEFKLKALAICEKVLPPDHPHLAASYNNVGSTYGNLGDHSKALEFKLKALEIREKVLPPEHPDLAVSYNNVGTTYSGLGDHSKALEFKLKALEIREKVLPPDHPDLSSSYNNVGGAYRGLGNHKKVLEYVLKALEIREKVLPPEHPDLATSYNNVGTTYGDLGDHNKALEFKLKALAICEKVLPPEHPSLATSYDNVGLTYGELGDHSKALEFKLKALEIHEKVLPPDHPHLAQSYNNVGITYGNLGDHRKSLEFLLKALEIRKKVLPPDHPHLAQSYNNVGITYGNLGDHRKSLEFLLKALEIRKKVLPPEHPDLAQSYNNVGITYAYMEDFPKAAEYLKKALAIVEKVLPPTHPYIASTKRNLAYVRSRMK